MERLSFCVFPIGLVGNEAADRTTGAAIGGRDEVGVFYTVSEIGDLVKRHVEVADPVKSIRYFYDIKKNVPGNTRRDQFAVQTEVASQCTDLVKDIFRKACRLVNVTSGCGDCKLPMVDSCTEDSVRREKASQKL
ncbi:hypothetical protein ScPMuIL_002556 [Solemya velum]